MDMPPDECRDDSCPDPIMPRKALLVWVGMIVGGIGVWIGAGWLIWNWVS